jgi:hypothetical protein
MLRLRVCLFLMAVVGGPAQARSGESDIFRRCTSMPAAAADAACANYVYGVLNLLPRGRPDAALIRNTCFPLVLSPSQASAIAENYARKHPERLGSGAATLRAEAFNSVFPCR